MRFILLAIFGIAFGSAAQAQTATVVANCSTVIAPYVPGSARPVTVDTNGNLCVGGGSSVPVAIKFAPLTIVTLDVKTVTTGGTAVTALTTGHKTAGGWIQNPPSATINLCINEIGAATGTTSSGDTTCIIPGATYNLVPSAGAVSVISSDSSHPFSGYGFQ